MSKKILIALILFSNFVYGKSDIYKYVPSQSLSGRSPESSLYEINTNDISSLASNDFPFAQTKKVLGKTISSESSASRSAIDASLYKNIAPSVVLILTKIASGSGSVISKDGLILTNYHVIENFKDVAVVFKPLKDAQKIQVSA